MPNNGAMRLDSARELKAELLAAPAAAAVEPARPRLVALGVCRRTRRDYRLAVRIQHPGLAARAHAEAIRERAKGEVDVRYVGRVSALAGPTRPARQSRQRPLRMGISIGHYRITAGTLGAFVQLGRGSARILSNNHVLADQDRGRRGDAILQPGAYDGGRDPDDRVGALAEWVRLSSTRPNRVDAALATIDEGVAYRAAVLTGDAKLKGVLEDPVDVDEVVEKLGRTTGRTRGRVTAFELDNVRVGYDRGDLRFDGQLEVEGAGAGPFSQGGDSGALVHTASGRLAVGLLFAGGESGGSNGEGLTFCNPVRVVLDTLRAELVL